MRKLLFKLLFTYEQRQSIINALWHRANHDSYQNSEEQNKEIRAVCEELARELML